MNTVKKGKIRLLFFKGARDKYFTGVCLDFGIVLKEKNFRLLKTELFKASIAYLKTVAKEKMSEELLSNQAEKKYFDLYEKFLKKELEKIKKTETVESSNIQNCSVECLPINDLLDNKCYA